MTRGGGSGIVEGVRSRSGIAMANRCAGDGGTTLAVGEKQPRRGFSSFFFFFLLSFFSFYWVWRGSMNSERKGWIISFQLFLSFKLPVN